MGKQGWKFLTEPNALVTRIFKAKYFPRRDFLSAELSRNPSYAWRGIWESKDLISRGYRWRVGDGADIEVWKDPWVKRDGRLRVESAVVRGLEDLKVGDLWIPGTREWDEELLESLFPAEEAEAIMSTVTAESSRKDEIIWHYEKKGRYSVKSAYRLYMVNNADVQELGQVGDWSRLWRLSLPPKLKHFLWKLTRRVLPTRTALKYRRRMAVPANCGLCDRFEEEEEHLFVTCDVAMDCWRSAELGEEIRQLWEEEGSLERWVWRVLNTWEDGKISKWAAVLWALWRERNQRVWNSESSVSTRIVDVGVQLVQEWRDVRKKEGRRGGEAGDRNVVCTKWHPPSGQKLKCNVDTGIRAADRRWSRGMLIRDYQGRMIRCRAAWSIGMPEPREGEALALLDAMVWIEEEGYQQVIFEVDSEIVAGAVNGRDEDLSEFGGIIERCRSFLHVRRDCSVVVVRRDRNKAAHELARQSFSLVSPSVWHTPPVWLENALGDKCMISH
ncbi:Putative ribonuclease H protein At1g65750 [Linum perenne]